MQIPFPLGLTRLGRASLEAVAPARFFLLQFATCKIVQLD